MLTRIVSHATFPSIVFTVAVLALAAAPLLRPQAPQPTVVVVPAPAAAATTIVNPSPSPVITPVYYPAYPYYWGNWRAGTRVCYHPHC